MLTLSGMIVDLSLIHISSVRKKLQQAISKSLKKHRELEKIKGKEKEPSL